LSRSEKKYGLVPLTFTEAARVLGISEPELEVFVMKTIRPGSDRWTKWSKGTLPLPEVVIRLYLTWLRTLAPTPTPHEAAAPPPVRTIKIAKGCRGVVSKEPYKP
jgi:hypothetical protein